MSRRTDLQNLISLRQRSLQKLKEQEATYGLATPTYIQLEIENIEAELDKLQAELDTLPPEADSRSGPPSLAATPPAGGGGPVFNFTGPIQAGQFNTGTTTYSGEINMNQDFSEKHVQGDEVHGDKVGGDKITTGNISGGGAVAIGRGAQASVTQGLSGPDLAKLFAGIYQTIEKRPDDPNLDKEELAETVKKVEQEAAKGEEANPTKVERWLGNLAKMAPDILEVTVACLTNPAAGVATVIRKVAEKAKPQAA